MMDHRTITDRLMAWYDGELSDAARREVEAHLSECAACHAASAQWRQTARALFRTPSVQTSEAFVSQVMGRLEALERPRRAPRWVARIEWWLPAVGLVGLFLVITATPPVSIEAVLLSTARAHSAAQLVFASEPPTTDEVFSALMEEGQP